MAEQYVFENFYFDNIGWPPPTNIPKYIKGEIEFYICSEYQIHWRIVVVVVVVCCLYIDFCMLLFSMAFKTAVFNLYCFKIETEN